MNKTQRIALLLLCVLIQTGWSQSKKEIRKVEELMWSGNDPDFAVTKIPDKWKNESAVFIARKLSDEYWLNANTYGRIAYRHYRVKLLDKSAVEEFSEFSFLKGSHKMGMFKRARQGRWASKDKVFVGFKVIKPNGKEEKIDLHTNMVEMQSTKNDYKKVAIPNLAPGDIIDYYHYVEQKIIKLYYLGFNTHNLSDQHPILKQHISITIPPKLELRCDVLGNAPLPTLENSRKRLKTYSHSYNNQEGYVKPIWIYPNKTIPTIRWRVLWAYETKNRGRLINNLSNTRLKKHYQVDLIKNDNNMYKEFRKWAEKKNSKKLKELPRKTVLKDLFYYSRFYWGEKLRLRRTYKKFRSLQSSMASNYFSRIGYVLRKLKIPFDISVAVFRHVGDTERQIGFSGCQVLLRTPDALIGPPYIHIMYDELPFRVQGVKAKVIYSSGAMTKPKMFTTPILPNNGVQTTLDVSVDQQALKLKRNTQVSGANKYRFQTRLVTQLDMANSSLIPDHPYLVEDKPKYKKEKGRKWRLGNLKKLIEDEYDQKIEKVESFELVQPGRTEKHRDMIFKDAFTLNAFVKKVGPNYIIEAGKLIGGQVEIKENQRTRKYDIYMDYPRSFEHTINFQVPAGYEVKGVDKFNFKVENETGGFISSATKEGNKVIIKSRKFYKHNFEKAEDWDKMVKFLDAAYQFTQQKLLLSKTSD
ncbi:MAG TPA: hypothetical protein DCS93_32195 [Microscillaceae bacterium]|nr:hypothetical protein [Microscillaceae bacterium]